MSTIYSRSRRRAGMTLIEILVVMAIIAILVSLLVVAVMAVFGKGYEAQNRNDLLNLSTALDRFKADKKFYPPSQLKLHANYTDYGTTQLDIQSLTFIAAMWPNLGQFTNVQWAGKNTVIPKAGFYLDGDQVLVFALGGPPQGPITLPIAAASVNLPGAPALMGGFSVNPTDPIDANNVLKNDRKSYINFDRARLFYRESDSPFPSYRDAYPEQGSKRPPSPFVYFSANKMKNGYDTENYKTLTTPVNSFYGVSPYITATTVANAPTVYYMSDTFQLLSAGLNGQFGPGGMWPAPAAAPLTAAQKKAIEDDVSNFSSAQLGANIFGN